MRVFFLLLLCATPTVLQAQQLSHSPDTMFHAGFESLSAGPFDDADAARFLTQATFGTTNRTMAGSTETDIAHLRRLGYAGWLTEQFSVTTTLQMDYENWVSNTLNEELGDTTLREAWFRSALGGPDPTNTSLIHNDQLRQRVAFALSEIFVVSDQNTALDQNPIGLMYFYDDLARGAFGNFRDLLETVTLSPAMGVYLNMQANLRADLSQNRHPDENYAREINQLFTIGLVMLNTDGSVQFSGGQPIATYAQSAITNFAHVFTGWDWASCTAATFGSCAPGVNDYDTPMAAFAAQHDNGSDATNDIINKQLLTYPGAANGGLLTPNGTPASDLKFALDNIFNHPNVGPFITKQLIQRLVTSNPSPQYVARVAGIFNDDGTSGHIRGNLQAVVQAILLDPEARAGLWANPDTFGKLREPLLRLTHLWRAMGAQHHCGQNYVSGTVTYHYANEPYRFAGETTAWEAADAIYGSGVGQAALDSSTVFNFFKPSYLPPGEMTTRTLFGPEFQINTDTLSTNITTSIATKTFTLDLTDSCTDYTPGGDVAIARSQDVSLAGTASGGASDPADTLVDAYNLRFMSGQMSPFMRQTLLSYLNPIGSTDGADWKLQRIDRALFLILTSPEYAIQK